MVFPQKKCLKIYIAGFDVFRPDAVQYGRNCCDICSKYGFCGLYPLDNEATNVSDIFYGNVSMIEQCDIIVANINDFRGCNMDDGTAWELGYGFAKGKKLYGYTNNSDSLVKRFGKTDENGFTIEDFDMPVNLMIGMSVNIIEGGFEDCIKAILKSD